MANPAKKIFPVRKIFYSGKTVFYWKPNFEKNELEDLAASIKSQGILQPIVVRKKDEDTFEIIAGERRWRAAQIAGLHEVPALIKEMNDDDVLQASLIENIQRENLNPVEEARAYQIILKNKDERKTCKMKTKH